MLCPEAGARPHMLWFFRLVAAAALVAIALPLTAFAQGASLTVYAAASMKNALDDADAAFTKATGINVVVVYAASSALAESLERGAHADVFISADLKWMDYAADHKLIQPNTQINLLGNRLVLIAAKDSKIDWVDIGKGFDIAKLADRGGIAIAGEDVPAGFMPRRHWRHSALGRQRSRSLSRLPMCGERLRSLRGTKPPSE
jgi:molybdate transport system substrate-binding protein